MAGVVLFIGPPRFVLQGTCGGSIRLSEDTAVPELLCKSLETLLYLAGQSGVGVVHQFHPVHGGIE